MLKRFFCFLVLVLLISFASALEESVCSQCGKGFFNICDEEECVSLGNCEAKAGFFRVLCIEIEEEQEEERKYFYEIHSKYYRPDYNSEHFKQWRQRNPNAFAEWYKGIERPEGNYREGSYPDYYSSTNIKRNIEVESVFKQLPQEEWERRYKATYGSEPNYSLMPQYFKEKNAPWAAIEWQPEYGMRDEWGKRIFGEEKIKSGTNELIEPLNQTLISRALIFQKTSQPTVEQAIDLGYIPEDYIPPLNPENYKPNYELPGMPITQEEIKGGFQLNPDYKYEVINKSPGIMPNGCIHVSPPLYYLDGEIISRCDICGCPYPNQQKCINHICVLNESEESEGQETQESEESENQETQESEESENQEIQESEESENQETQESEESEGQETQESEEFEGQELIENNSEISLRNNSVELISPLDNTIFVHDNIDSLGRDYVKISFNWDFFNKELVDYYVFVVDSNYGHGEVNVSSTNRIGKYTGIGNFNWKIKACNLLECSNWSETRTLIVKPLV
jgi:hypothetical protein